MYLLIINTFHTSEITFKCTERFTSPFPTRLSFRFLPTGTCKGCPIRSPQTLWSSSIPPKTKPSESFRPKTWKRIFFFYLSIRPFQPTSDSVERHLTKICPSIRCSVYWTRRRTVAFVECRRIWRCFSSRWRIQCDTEARTNCLRSSSGEKGSGNTSRLPNIVPGTASAEGVCKASRQIFNGKFTFNNQNWRRRSDVPTPLKKNTHWFREFLVNT